MSVPVSGIFWRKETCAVSSIGVYFFPMLTFIGWSLIKSGSNAAQLANNFRF